MESKLKRDGVKGVDEKKFAWDDFCRDVRDAIEAEIKKRLERGEYNE